jgi:hypothetical protein
MRFWLSFLMLVLFAFSCQPTGQNGSGERDSISVLFSEEVVEEESAACGKDSSRCTRVVLQFPMVTKAAPAVQKRINDTLEVHVMRLFSPISDEDSGSAYIETPEEAAEEFVAVYEDFLVEEPDYTQAWYAEVEGQLLFRNSNLATVKLECSTYTGGAHPLYYVDLITFGLQDGEVVDLNDLIADKTVLMALAEKYFRQARELEAEQSLQDAGFFWDGNFALPRNMGLTEKGLYLFYNQYEVAPYAAGPTELVIPFEELKPILTKPAILGLD